MSSPPIHGIHGACGYSCERGTPPLTRDILLQELPSFLDAWAEQRSFFSNGTRANMRNEGGNSLLHSFGLWALLRTIKPPFFVESGVAGGETSWLARRATAAWKPTMVRIDPRKLGWEDDTPGATTHDFRGPTFQDFGKVPWASLGVDPARTFVLFDDHMDQLARLSQAAALGFRQFVFDDNWMPGFGDLFSVKNACDGGLGGASGPGGASSGCGGGRLRRTFSHKRHRCTTFHAKCEPATDAELAAARDEFLRLAEVYYEVPPLSWPAERKSGKPRSWYGTVNKWVGMNKYDGPHPWTANHTALVEASTKPPLFTMDELLERVTAAVRAVEAKEKASGAKRVHQLAWADKIAKLEFLHAETQQYFHMAYVRTAKIE